MSSPSPLDTEIVVDIVKLNRNNHTTFKIFEEYMTFG